MNIQIHHVNHIVVAEVISNDRIINHTEDGFNLLGDLYFQDFDHIILHEKNITPDFFDLKTGIAGEILQKFSNYRVRLAIVGNFSTYNSKSLDDFISESNRSRQINFVPSLAEALQKLST